MKIKPRKATIQSFLGKTFSLAFLVALFALASFFLFLHHRRRTPRNPSRSAEWGIYWINYVILLHKGSQGIFRLLLFFFNLVGTDKVFRVYYPRMLLQDGLDSRIPSFRKLNRVKTLIMNLYEVLKLLRPHVGIDEILLVAP